MLNARPDADLSRMQHSAADVDRIIAVHFPEIHSGGQTMFTEAVGPGTARMRLKADVRHLRPGGTISGPTLFTLADVTLYAMIIGELGEGALQAVTTTMTINFLSRPDPGDVIAECQLLKRGRRLIVADVRMARDGQPGLIAQATATYALPPDGLSAR
jgi:uncharacterized protein (TIGR00369 family)